MGCSVPKFYGFPKSWTPPQAYSVQQRIKILKQLVGRSPHHIHSTGDFVEQANKVTLLPGDCLNSYDVTVLFTSVPVEAALGIIKDLLEQDNIL